MGMLLFEAEEKGFKTIIETFYEKLLDAGVKEDGSAEVQIIIQGKAERTMSFTTKGIDELLEILRLNAE